MEVRRGEKGGDEKRGRREIGRKWQMENVEGRRRDGRDRECTGKAD